MSDRIAIFNDGRIVQVADPTVLYERPASEFVADFIGESNLFRGRLLQRDGNLCLQSGELCLRVEAQDGWSAGQDATVVVRPERLRLLPSGRPPTEGWNVADGHTVEITYLGDVVKHVVELDERRHARRGPDAGGRPARSARDRRSGAGDVAERRRHPRPWDAPAPDQPG